VKFTVEKLIKRNNIVVRVYARTKVDTLILHELWIDKTLSSYLQLKLRIHKKC